MTGPAATPHSPFAPHHSPYSNPLDDLLAEQPLRAVEQEQERDHVGEPGLDAAADQRAPIELAELLADADDEPAHDRPRDRGEAAENEHRQGFERDDLEREGHVRARAPHDPGDERDDARRKPDDDPDLVERDADRERRLVAVGDRAQRAAD